MLPSSFVRSRTKVDPGDDVDIEIGKAAAGILAHMNRSPGLSPQHVGEQPVHYDSRLTC